MEKQLEILSKVTGQSKADLSTGQGNISFGTFESMKLDAIGFKKWCDKYVLRYEGGNILVKDNRSICGLTDEELYYEYGNGN